MNQKKFLTYFIVMVWFVNGFFCKILNLVPRHEEIIARILNAEYSREITIIIGVLEILMVLWILSNFKSWLCSITQISIIIIMNIIELLFAKDLLLWGKLNMIFAMLFVSMIYYNEFVVKKK